MKKILLVILILLTACNTAKNEKETHASDKSTSNYPVLTVTKIENGKDGYTATLKDNKEGLYTCTISIPNLEDNFVQLEIGDKVKITGDYAESYPVQIFAKHILKVE